MSFPNPGLISLLEAGSGFDPEKPADPALLRYRTSIYPEEAGVDLLVRDIEQFRALADSAETRIRPFLLKIAYSLDCALASKSSEGGKMLNLLNTSRSVQALYSNGIGSGKKGDPLDKLNEMFGDMTDPNKNADYGNKKY